MKKVVLFIFLALGIISFSANYSKGKATELKIVKITDNKYGFCLAYYPEKDGVGKDEPLKARESRDEVGIATKKGNSYYYEGISYGELCQIEITESSKRMKVNTNNECSGHEKYNGTYNYSGETSEDDAESLKSLTE